MHASRAPLNVVLILADQLRADSVGCYENSIVQTPHIDRLAAEGTRFTQAFAQHPQCAPSRASIMTSRYPHVNGGISNYVAMAPNEQTIGEHLRAAGYHTFAGGKLHLFRQKEESSFDKVQLSGGQHSNATHPDVLANDYKQWAKTHGYWDDLVQAYEARRDPSYQHNFQAVVSPMPAEAYIDCWVGDQSAAFIRRQPADQPFFIFAGFPNPHNPFEPPEPYASMYDLAKMPLPATFHSDLSNKPLQQYAYKRYGRRNIGADYENLDGQRLKRVIAYYYASISLVDDQVGKILRALEERKFLDNTIILFLSDHGELLGHHGMLLKGTDAYPILYDKSLHVPLVCRIPGMSGGRAVHAPVELIDVVPTVLEYVGLASMPAVQGKSLAPFIRGEEESHRESIFAESGAVKILRGEQYKLVYYPNQPYGELYDLEVDPLEVNNLYDETKYRSIRTDITTALLDRLIHTEAPLHGESKRSTPYWRTLYCLPFEDASVDGE